MLARTMRSTSLLLASLLIWVLAGCDAPFQSASAPDATSDIPANAAPEPTTESIAEPSVEPIAISAPAFERIFPDGEAQAVAATAEAPHRAAQATDVAAASPTRAFEFSAEDAPEPINRCGFEGLKIPDGTQVYAAGAYSGAKLPFQIDDSGHEATRMEVAVNHAQAPVILMLGAYEPTVWSVGWTRETRIVAVLLSGYHAQKITGLPPEVPVLVSTYDNRGACGHFYVSVDQATRLNPIARRVFGRPVDMLYPVRNGKVLIGDALRANALVTDAAAPAIDTFRLADTQLAGRAGLQQAVRRGELRPATQQDAQAWQEIQSAKQQKADAPPIAGGTPAPPEVSLHNAYVVLKAFRFPAGLYGANLATFFVPEGVPAPAGNRGHSTVYDFNTAACSGAMCRRDD